jgi:hypothetical protein
MITHRMILIDPKAWTIEDVACSTRHADMAALVGTEDVDTFTIADFGETTDHGMVDDFGLAREKPVYAFRFRLREDPIAGKCLIFGASKRDGVTCDAASPLDVLRREIIWLGRIVPSCRIVTEGDVIRTVVTWTSVS